MDTAQTVGFLDRRGSGSQCQADRTERRQFGDSRDGLSADVRELADAIDAYKLAHRRRFVTLSEVIQVVKELGYHK